MFVWSKMKRHITVLIIITVFITTVTSSWYTAVASPVNPRRPSPPTISAASAVLIDARTGDTLWRRHSDIRRPMASTTKTMTALVAIENGNLDDVVTVNKDALGPGAQGGIGLSLNEHVKLRDLLYALMLPSANDAAVAIADHVGGSVSGFAAMMNKKAAAIGAHRTHFVNPHGLDATGHYTTAYDLALIDRYAMRNKTFEQLVSSRSRWIDRSSSRNPVLLKSHNNLLYTYTGLTGGKTGYTSRAGNCLVFSATRGGVSLVGAVMGVKMRPDLWKDSAVLLNYGFSLYTWKHIIAKGSLYKTTTTQLGQKVELVANEDAHKIVRNTLPVEILAKTAKDITGPVKKGEVVGKVTAYQAGRAVAISDLIVKNATEPATKPAAQTDSKQAQPTLTQVAHDYAARSSFALFNRDNLFKSALWPASRTLTLLRPLNPH